MIASKQIAENYVETGRKKAELPVSHMLITRLFRRECSSRGRRRGLRLPLAAMIKCLSIADCFGTRIPGRIGAGGLHRGGTFHWELPDDDLGAAETDFRGRAV